MCIFHRFNSHWGRHSPLSLIRARAANGFCSSYHTVRPSSCSTRSTRLTGRCGGSP
jgi:hypothetical protein